MSSPSIKGSVVAVIVEHARRLLTPLDTPGADPLEDLEPDERKLLDDGVMPATWVPLSLYTRVVDRVARLEPGLDVEATLHVLGQNAAAALRLSGVYSQLRPRETDAYDARTLRRMLSLWPGLFDFGKVQTSTLTEDPLTFRIDVLDAQDCPDPIRSLLRGFIEDGFRHVSGAGIQVQTTARERDRVVYEIRSA